MRAFLGRCMFAAVFISSVIPKLQTFGDDGGPFAGYATPKLKTFYSSVQDLTGFELPAVEVKYLLAAAMFLEGVGGILYIFGSQLGATMMMIFLVGVTPVMHDFWNMEGEAQMPEMVNFMKNLALLGALLQYSSMKSSMAGKVKAD